MEAAAKEEEEEADEAEEEDEEEAAEEDEEEGEAEGAWSFMCMVPCAQSRGRSTQHLTKRASATRC